MKRLGIEVFLKDKITRSVKDISGAVKTSTTAFKEWGEKGRKAIELVSHALTGLKAGLDLVSNAVRGFWETFIVPAENARKLTASLTNVFGGGTADKIRQFSLETGLSFEAVSKAALDMSDTLGQVGGLDNYLKAIERVSKWRPDLGAEGAISYVNSLIDRLKETSGAGSKQLGRYTSVVTGGVGAQAMDLGKELDKLGVIAQVVDPATTALDRLRAAWAKFAADVGGQMLDELVDAMVDLLDWLTKNEDKVLALTQRFAELVGQGLKAAIDWLSSDKPAEVWEKIKKFVEDITPLVMMIANALQGVGSFIGGIGKGGGSLLGKMAQQPAGVGAWGKKVMDNPIQALGIGGQGILSTPFQNTRLGKLFGGGGGMGRQQVEVTVGVDRETGNLTPFVNDQIGRNNFRVAETLAGGNLTPAYGTR